jgi:hypothetical protein
MRKQISLLFLVLLVSCSQHKNITPRTEATSPGTLTSSQKGAIPTLLVPKPNENNGVVVGQLVMRGSGEFLGGLPVYLGQLLPNASGPGFLLTVQEKSSPHTTTDSDGRFALSAAPGEYVFLIWTMVHSVVLINPATNREWKVNIKAGETTDAGKIEAEWP